MSLSEFIFKLNPKIKLLGIIIALIAGSYLLYIFMMTPLLQQRDRLKLSLVSQRKLLEVRTSSTTKIDKVEKELSKTQSEGDAIEARFLTEERLPAFFTELRDLASYNSVKVLNLKVGEKKPVGKDTKDMIYKYEEVPIDLSLSGNYRDTMKFFGQLRKKEIVSSISEMAISADKDQKDAVKTNLRLVLYLVYE